MSSQSSFIARDLAVAKAVCRRDLLRFSKESSRWVGVVAQPLLFWFVIGSGLTASMVLQAAPQSDGVESYVHYFFPGTMLLTVVFTCVFASISIIEDKRAGFLRAVLVSPGSRAALVAGKLFGIVLLCFIQCGFFLLAAPLANFSWMEVNWPELALALLLTILALAGINFAAAWKMNSTQGYHAVMSIGLLPLWMVSGAMFPRAEGFLGLLLCWNPLSPMLAVMRAAMQGTAIYSTSWIILFSFAGAAVALAIFVTSSSGAGVLNAAD